MVRRIRFVLATLALAALLTPHVASAGPIAHRLAAGGFHSLWLANDGLMWGSGYNYTGALGDGTYTNRTRPVAVGYFNDWIQVSAGYYSSYGIRKGGSLWAWGYNKNGQLGTGSTAEKISRPARVGTAEYKMVSAGAIHVLAIREDGTLWAWGDNMRGELGTGNRTSSKTPKRVGGRSDWVYVAAGGYHSIGQTADGSWWGWGFNGDGQLSKTSFVDHLVPTLLAGSGVYDAMYPGGFQTFGRYPAGSAKPGQLAAWGRNQWGQLGRGYYDPANEPAPTPLPVSTYVAFYDVAAGWHHTLGLQADGHVMAWGMNKWGEGGFNSAMLEVPTPTSINSIDHVTEVAAGESFSLARRIDATIWAWGNNGSGQLGLGALSSSPAPVEVTKLDKAFLTKPTAPSTLALGSTFSATGFLLPNHVAPVKVEIWRSRSGVWVKMKQFSPSVVKTATGARWSVSYKPGYRGSWYVQASHTDKAHAPSFSAKRTITVK